ncbi:MAG: PD40 domain-containing protein [Polyangiaceae bacterium]|nr:PD40 domain-containing protein [Polyangiaceae bacterium]
MRALAVTLALSLVACGADDGPEALFREQVAPVLEQRCASAVCHGVREGAEAQGEVIDWEAQLLFRIDRYGLLTDPDAAYVTAKRAINSVEVEASSLLRKPLHVELGGLPHLGGANFHRRDMPAYAALRRWIESEADGGEDPPPLDPGEQYFADAVQPALAAGTCFDSTCHGPSAGSIPYRLEPSRDGSFSTEATRHNYRVSRRMLALGGDARQSRLLRKSMPLAGPGIFHKGTNFDFYAGDPFGGAKAIEAWACFERERATGHGCTTAGASPISGFVFVRGPAPTAQVFDLDVFEPGSDLLLASTAEAALTPSKLTNLTAALHDQPADIRDPAVSPDGRHVVFAMRTSPASGHHLWEVELETRKARQLTFGNGPLKTGGLATDRDPTYGPDGSVWFVSTRAGRLADGGQRLDAELMSLDEDDGLRRWTHTPHVERKPVFLEIGEEAGGEVAFTALRQVIPSQSRAHSFRFPPSLATEYHQHFGINSKPTLFHDLRELPDGRYVSLVAELDAPQAPSRLGVIDRNFGPELGATTAPGQAAIAPYTSPLVLLEADDAKVGYRDPAPLPDGRVLVTRVVAEGSSVQTRIDVLTLSEHLDGSGAWVSQRATLVDDGTASDPEPVFVRPPIHLDAPPFEPAADRETALLVHNGAPMIDAILSRLEPAGEKRLRDDLRFVRLIEALPETPSSRAPVPHAKGATTTSLGWHGKSRILAELPLADDGSFQASVPARVPFRIQFLNEQRMAVGHPHNRWFDLQPGQTLTQGLSVSAGIERYDARCASCHGAASGDGTNPPRFEAPDLVSAASLTLSRYQAQDPRRPLPPAETGDPTRIGVDFVKDVQPILSARCAGCHGGATPAAQLALESTATTWYSVAYEALLDPTRSLVDADTGSAFRSHLIERLTGNELGAKRKLPHAAAHPGEHGAATLSKTELLTLVRWLDLGASFRGEP